ncbi:hypothetical protein BVC80_9085g131 [Macleaya cordata]|uniref:Transmembrane protein n=1 Tax=Macleaya cordata TaxID=56857 RepID=A0A200PR57_MACCD|nr:hypothetical protein BVC80_9085g131 [Macleaya cordata]
MAAVVSISSACSTLNLVNASGEYNLAVLMYCRSRRGLQLKTSDLQLSVLSHKIQTHHNKKKSRLQRKFTVLSVTQGSSSSSNSTESDNNKEKIPTWAKPDSDEPPPWARSEANIKDTSQGTFEVPFYAYLLASTITAIAAIGSIFEYINQKPVFGVLDPDSIFYAPLLGFFVFTGVPTSAFLWFKSVQAANKAAEEQDRRDGYR